MRGPESTDKSSIVLRASPLATLYFTPLATAGTCTGPLETTFSVPGPAVRPTVDGRMGRWEGESFIMDDNHCRMTSLCTIEGGDAMQTLLRGSVYAHHPSLPPCLSLSLSPEDSCTFASVAPRIERVHASSGTQDLYQLLGELLRGGSQNAEMKILDTEKRKRSIERRIEIKQGEAEKSLHSDNLSFEKQTTTAAAQHVTATTCLHTPCSPGERQMATVRKEGSSHRPFLSPCAPFDAFSIFSLLW